MKCPFCNHQNTNVKDSRNSDDSRVIRRRRHCSKCGGRFTTFERTQLRELVVVKRSGSKRPFDPTKIAKSISTAIRKRNISDKVMEDLTNSIVLQLESGSSKEVSSRKIGKLILQELAKIDQVAYVRFASVYKDFTSIEDFSRFIGKIQNSTNR